jgi:hypothetical protein
VFHVIIKRTHAGEVAREDDAAVRSVTNNHAPIPDEVNQAASAPTLVGGDCERRVARVAPQRVPQPQKQIVTIIESTIPMKDLRSAVWVNWPQTIQDCQLGLCILGFLSFGR